MERANFLLVSCEHAGNEVPAAWAALFSAGGPDGLPSEATEAILAGHRGWDPGAAGVASRLASTLAAPVLLHRVTRLLADVNRSVDAPDLLSEFSRGLAGAERARLLAEVHAPHRASVERIAASAIRSGLRVLHVSVHSFADSLDGVRRDLELGVLFDPARVWERRLAEAWAAAMADARPDWRVMHNEPYLGVADGLTTSVRRRFGGGAYAGIELEIRQGLIGTPAGQRAVADTLAAALRRLVETTAAASFDAAGAGAGGRA